LERLRGSSSNKRHCLGKRLVHIISTQSTHDFPCTPRVLQIITGYLTDTMTPIPDEPLEWKFDSAMPQDLKALVQESGKPDPRGSTWLVVRNNVISGGKHDPFFLVDTGEQLETTFYPCVRCYPSKSRQEKRRSKQQWGVVVVQGPSIPRPVIIGSTKTRFAASAQIARDLRWATWHGKKDGYSTRYVARGMSPKPNITPGSEDSESDLSGLPDGVSRSGTTLDDLGNDDGRDHDIEDVANHDDTNRDVNNLAVVDDREADSSIVTRRACSVAEETREITVRFLSNSFELLRKRSWESCNDSERFFAQAIAAGLVEPRKRATLLTVRVAGFEKDMILLKNDEEDFADLQDLIESTADVKTESGGKWGLELDVFSTEGARTTLG
jgi:hypothetical protein